MLIHIDDDQPTRAELEEPVHAWCPSCQSWHIVKTIDESFSHEFGIHRQYSYGCAECDLPRSQMLDSEPIDEPEFEE